MSQYEYPHASTKAVARNVGQRVGGAAIRKNSLVIRKLEERRGIKEPRRPLRRAPWPTGKQLDSTGRRSKAGRDDTDECHRGKTDAACNHLSSSLSAHT